MECSLNIALPLQSINFMLVPPEHILVAPGEISMDLSWQEGIFGNVGSSGVVI
jgi:hypothetical protein